MAPAAPTARRRLLDLFEESGRNVQRAARCCCATCSPTTRSTPTLARDLLLCEQEGDRITHDIIHRLNGGGRAAAPPFDAADVHALAGALDDIVDYAEEAADQLGLYGVEAPMEQARSSPTSSSARAEQVAEALRGAAHGRRPRAAPRRDPPAGERGRPVSRDGVASLFADGIDPMVVIRWKDIFEPLEAAVDACEKVAHVLEGIALRAAIGAQDGSDGARPALSAAVAGRARRVRLWITGS